MSKLCEDVEEIDADLLIFPDENISIETGNYWRSILQHCENCGMAYSASIGRCPICSG